MSNKEIKIGDIVRYIGKEHDTDPEVNPPVGTLGKVLRETRTPDSVLYFIQREKGSTSDDDCWYQSPEEVELVEDIKIGKTGKSHIDFDVSDEEIWEFLKPKMEKNGLKIAGYINGVACCVEDDVHNAIALAYRSGYLRAMKGRPFKIGEKKKKGGHWEPVDPNNLPKEGTRVRYSREYKGYNWLKDSLCIGTKGTLTIDGPYSRIGMMLDRPTSFLAWADFEDEEAIACLDMWVEDDE